MTKTCECGCGQLTTVATKTDRRDGRVKGHPTRFLPGHNARLRITPPADVDPKARRCVKCRYPIVGTRQPAPRGWRQHYGRGLCSVCWHKVDESGDLIDFERSTRTRDEVLDEWVLLRAEGHTTAQAAARLCMTFEAFARALQRARRTGDPRALPALSNPARKAS